MTGSIALDIVIGLIFIYSLYSLLTTTVTELIITWCKLRQAFLSKGIRRMLDGAPNNPLLFETFFKQPLIKMMGSGDLWGFFDKPAYLSAENFSKTTIDALKEIGSPLFKDAYPIETIKTIEAALNHPSPIASTDTAKLLRSFLADSGYDTDKFKHTLEQWYDDTMQRVSGWYKKWIQLLTFIIGLAIAIIFNVDTLKIANTLSTDSKSREQFVSLAENLIANESFTKVLYYDDSLKHYDTLRNAIAILRKEALTSENILSADRNPEGGLAINLAGWIITAFALSLGAPFWFDLLNKLTRLRSSIKIESINKNET
jgi:hypothetical protein